jgi:hypothetical protein
VQLDHHPVFLPPFAIEVKVTKKSCLEEEEKARESSTIIMLPGNPPNLLLTMQCCQVQKLGLNEEKDDLVLLLLISVGKQ